MTRETSWDVTSPDILQSEPLDLSSPDTVPTSVLVKQVVTSPSPLHQQCKGEKPEQSAPLIARTGAVCSRNGNKNKRHNWRQHTKGRRSEQRLYEGDIVNEVSIERERKKRLEERVGNLRLLIIPRVSHPLTRSKHLILFLNKGIHEDADGVIKACEPPSQESSNHGMGSNTEVGGREQHGARIQEALKEKRRYQEGDSLKNSLRELEELKRDVLVLLSMERQAKWTVKMMYGGRDDSY